MAENSWHRYDMKKLRQCHPMYKKKGLGLLWAEKKETSRRLVLRTARQVPDVMFFLPARRVPTCSDWNYMSAS